MLFCWSVWRCSGRKGHQWGVQNLEEKYTFPVWLGDDSRSGVAQPYCPVASRCQQVFTASVLPLIKHGLNPSNNVNMCLSSSLLWPLSPGSGCVQAASLSLHFAGVFTKTSISLAYIKMMSMLWNSAGLRGKTTPFTGWLWGPTHQMSRTTLWLPASRYQMMTPSLMPRTTTAKKEVNTPAGVLQCNIFHIHLNICLLHYKEPLCKVLFFQMLTSNHQAFSPLNQRVFIGNKCVVLICNA